MKFEELPAMREKAGMEKGMQKGRLIEKIRAILSNIEKLKRKNMTEEEAFAYFEYTDEDIQLHHEVSGWLASHEGMTVEDYADQEITADTDTEWDDTHRA